MNVLALRHSGYWNQPLLATEHACYLVHVGTLANPLPDAVSSRYERIYYVPNWDSLAKLAAVAADLQSREIVIDAIASSTEHTQFAAGFLAGLLGLSHPSLPVVLRTRDKRAMKAAARQAGIPTAQIASVPGSRLTPTIADAADRIGYPLIVKPASGFGTIATSLVHDEVELSHALELATDDDLPSPDMAIEEFIDADEFHVDAVWRNGEPWVFTVSRYATSPRLLREGVGPDLSILLNPADHAELYAAARRLHEQLNGAMGIRRGATHLEFFRRRSGELVFSEIGTRLGGGNIPNLIGAHCGVDLREAFFHELLGGDPAELDWAAPEYPYVALLNMVPGSSGSIERLPDADALRTVEGVLDVSIPASVGDAFVIGHSSSEWTVVVVIGAQSEAGVRALADDLATRFPIAVGSSVSL